MKIRLTGALAAATAAVLAFSLAACSGTASAPSAAVAAAAGTATIPLLRVGFDLDLTTLDNTKVIDADELDQMGLEQLLKFGPQGQVEPNVATSWAQTSPVTYVYRLRHGVKFWDGHPLTATDVAYSLNYERAPGSQVAFAFSAVKSIVATNSYTVTVTLSAPYAGWQYVPAEGVGMIFEKAFQQAHRAAFGLRIGDDAALSTLDTGTDEGNDVYGTLETLTTFGSNGQVEPDLASSVSHPDAVTYVYNLRQGVKFWDGNPMTSADVVNALDYYRKPGSYVSTEVAPVKSVTATGPYTVVVTLKSSYAPWSAETTGQFPIFEKKFADEHKTTMGQPGTLTMGTGPWEIDSFDPTTGLELSANPHWWGGTVPIKHISIKLFASETSEALAFRGGEIDVATDVLNPRSFASTSGGTLVSAPAFSEGYFGMNVQKAPWNDLHVRRAVAYALDRPDIIAALGNNAEPVTTLIPPAELDRLGSPEQVSAMINALPSYPYNLAKAKQEMAESAYPHGFTATTQTITFASYTPVNEAVAADLAKIGINLKLKTIGFTQYLAFASGDKSAIGALYATMNVTNADADSLPSALLGSVNIADGGYDWADYDPPAINTLIQQGEATQNPAQRLAIYGQMLKTLAIDLPYVPLYIQNYNVALAGDYTWPGYNVYTQTGAWELNIKSKN